MRYAMSVCDMTRKVICDIYDSQIPIPGEAESLQITKERNGWKELSFEMPRYLPDGAENDKMQYMVNEYQIRLTEGSKTDYYTIVTPTDIHSGAVLKVQVIAEHSSAILKTRNLFGYFDDTNGIGTCDELITKALTKTGWRLTACDKFYEADGETEKIRSYSCEEKTGAWDMIQKICELFRAYPVFDGDKRTVAIRSKQIHDELKEITFGRNTEKIERKRSSSDIVTRLYVQGDYTDNGYVGIDDAAGNESHLNFILNFDYYREIGAFTEMHEAALAAFIRSRSQTVEDLMQLNTMKLSAERDFGDVISTYPAIFYRVSNGTVVKKYPINYPTADQINIKKGDELAYIKTSGSNVTEYEYKTFSGGGFGSGVTWLAKFPVTLNGLLMTAENFANTAEKNTPEKAEEYRELARGYLSQGITVAQTITSLQEQIDALQETATITEDDFVETMGDMLHEGYWMDSQYITGQEDSLYADALDISKQMAYPQYEWKCEIEDMSYDENDGDRFDINQMLRIYDEKMGLKTYAYVDKITIYPRQEQKNSITITTDEIGVSAKSLENILSRITDMAELLNTKKGVYQRAEIVDDNGAIAAQRLAGMIDISKNKILSTPSSMYTDETGNMIFVAMDGNSAMMLTGMGFMVANGKTEDGEWNWRTFGTGDGFTADMIVAGFMSGERIQAGTMDADRITSGSITTKQINAEVGQSLDLTGNETIQLAVTHAISDMTPGARNYLRNSFSLVTMTAVVKKYATIKISGEDNAYRRKIQYCGTFYAGGSTL